MKFYCFSDVANKYYIYYLSYTPQCDLTPKSQEFKRCVESETMGSYCRAINDCYLLLYYTVYRLRILYKFNVVIYSYNVIL